MLAFWVTPSDQVEADWAVFTRDALHAKDLAPQLGYFGDLARSLPSMSAVLQMQGEPGHQFGDVRTDFDFPVSEDDLVRHHGLEDYTEMKYRVVWTLEDGRKMASEYAGRAEAEFHQRDIAGWMPDASLEEVNDGSPPRPGPFEVCSPKTWHERLES